MASESGSESQTDPDLESIVHCAQNTGETDVPPADIKLAYDDLWYIKTRSETDKRAKEKWGGYDQDYADAPNVYTHADVVDSRETNWGIVGIQDRPHETRSLLIFDLDIHKAPDGFDVSRVTVPEHTLIVKSQNGGLHVYFAVRRPRGDGMESDFDMQATLPWDIDIRGSFVNMHVCAPRQIPGIDGRYEIVNDESLAYRKPSEAAALIKLDGKPLLDYDPGGRNGSRDFEAAYDRASDPPADMPRCYHAGLELRADAPDDHGNTHQVNTYTALCGLAAGYSVDTMVEHFIDDYPPGDTSAADEDETRYQLDMMAQKMEAGGLQPPAISSLQKCGILPLTDVCDGTHCGIDYHSPEYGLTPECPDCGATLGGHCRLDADRDGPWQWQCSQCYEFHATAEVVPDV